MHRACVLTPRCRPHHQAARKHTTQLPSPAVCLMRWSPRRGKCPIPFRGGRSPPRLLEKGKKDSTSLARSPTSRQVPFLHTSTTSPRPRPRPRPRSRPILTSPVFRPNSSSSPRDDGCYKTVRHRFCTYPGPVRLCLLPLPPVDSPPPHRHDPWQWARPGFFVFLAAFSSFVSGTDSIVIPRRHCNFCLVFFLEPPSASGELHPLDAQVHPKRPTIPSIIAPSSAPEPRNSVGRFPCTPLCDDQLGPRRLQTLTTAP